jgi:hypothetical protein
LPQATPEELGMAELPLQEAQHVLAARALYLMCVMRIRMAQAGKEPGAIEAAIKEKAEKVLTESEDDS